MSKFIFKKDTSIGQLDAETDHLLEECFIETEAYKTLISYDSKSPQFRKRIIVGAELDLEKQLY